MYSTSMVPFLKLPSLISKIIKSPKLPRDLGSGKTIIPKIKGKKKKKKS